MFHGITANNFGWQRVLTSTPLKKGERILDQFDNGVYWPVFLETFFPGMYRLEVRKLDKTWYNGVKSEAPRATMNPQPGEVLRWSTDTDQYTVFVDGVYDDSWLTPLVDAGLLVGNSKKMSKRFAEIARLSCAWQYRPGGDMNIEVIDHEALAYLDSDVDGISAISQSFAIKCFAANHLAKMEWVGSMIDKVVSGRMTVVQLRVLTPMGLIKGNALVLPDHMMKGYDIRTFKPNIKSELKTAGWQLATIEPSYGTIPVKSDDLTHAIYQDVHGLYTAEDLLTTLQQYLNHEEERLHNGERSASMTALVDNAMHLVTATAEGPDDDVKDPRSTLQMVQEAIRDLSALGVPYEATQTLRFLTVHGVATQFMGQGFNSGGKLNNIWREKSRHWFPVAWAYAAHIITQEVLDIFGFKNVYSSNGYYHKRTHCFAVPGKFFNENLANHGGPDLDDTFKVHIRMADINGEMKMVAFLLRNPNDFGEWSVIEVDEAGPVFHNYTDTPPVIDLEEINTKVPQLSYLLSNGLIKPGSLAGIHKLTIGSEFSLVDEARSRMVATVFPGGVGSAVLPKIMYYALMKTYIAKPVCSNEDMLDALTQGMLTVDDAVKIQQWCNRTFARIINAHGMNGTKMDLFWMETRLPKRFAEGIDATTMEESPWCSLHIFREMLVRVKYAEMVDYLNTTMVQPDIIMNIEFTEEELAAGDEQHEKLSIKQKQLSADQWVAYMTDLLQRTDDNVDKGIEFTNRRMLLLARQSYIAKQRYPRQSHDQWLFTFSNKSENQVVDWYIRALESIQPEEGE